jgi:hypothetical protein
VQVAVEEPLPAPRRARAYIRTSIVIFALPPLASRVSPVMLTAQRPSGGYVGWSNAAGRQAGPVAAPGAAMRWLLGCGTLFALAFLLFVVPAGLEGPVLVPISPGHGLSLVDVVALLPLLAGTGLLARGLWQRRQELDAALTWRPWLARAGALAAGLGLGLLVASVFAFFWWWAIGAALLSATLLAAAVAATLGGRKGAGR